MNYVYLFGTKSKNHVAIGNKKYIQHMCLTHPTLHEHVGNLWSNLYVAYIEKSLQHFTHTNTTKKDAHI
jgi:hypothetical protein